MGLMYDGLVMNYVEMKMELGVILWCVWRRMGCGDWGGKESYLCRKGVNKMRKKRKKKALAKQQKRAAILPATPMSRVLVRSSAPPCSAWVWFEAWEWILMGKWIVLVS